MTKLLLKLGLPTLLLTTVLGTSLAAQKKKYAGIKWVPSYEQAIKDARDRGCPVMAVINSTSAYDATTKVIHGDKSVIKATKYMVCVIGQNDYRPPKDKDKDKAKAKAKSKGKDKDKDKKKGAAAAAKPRPDTVAEIYGTIKVTELVKNYNALYNRFVRRSPVQTTDVPQHIYIDPVTDEELFRRLGGLTRKEMEYDLARAQKLVGKGVSARLAGDMREKLTEALTLITKGQYKRAAELLEDYLKFKKKYDKKLRSALFKDGDDLIVDLEDRGQDMIREAKDLAEAGDMEKAKHLLERVYREFRPFEVSDMARRTLFEVRKKKK